LRECKGIPLEMARYPHRGGAGAEYLTGTPRVLCSRGQASALRARHHNGDRQMTQKNDGPETIDTVNGDRVIAAVLVKALQQRVETLEAQVEALEVGVNTPLISDADRDLEWQCEQMRDRIAVLQEENRNIIRTLESLRGWMRGVERLVDPNGDIDLT